LIAPFKNAGRELLPSGEPEGVAGLSIKSDVDLATLRAKHRSFAPALDRRGRRLWAAAEAKSLGHGGIALVVRATGISATEALALYRRRRTVDRMFYDLKEVLNLNCFYSANTNAVAMQVYAAAIVYVAMRTAQARIARAVRRPPEHISPANLFPRVAVASEALAAMESAFLHTKEFNPGVRLKEPPWENVPEHRVALKSILVEQRKGPRRKRRYCAARRHHVSLHRFTRRKRIRQVDGDATYESSTDDPPHAGSSREQPRGQGAGGGP
jgi:hypothetical protein